MLAGKCSCECESIAAEADERGREGKRGDSGTEAIALAVWTGFIERPNGVM